MVCVAIGSTTLTYQWRKVTGTNSSEACTAADGAGFNTTSFTPSMDRGRIRYFCLVTDGMGNTVESEIAEVLVGCGAYIDSGWLAFMCYNLGADETLDPFTPAKGLHGAKYRFGAKEASLTMEQDQAGAGAFSGWTVNSTPDFPYQQDANDWNPENDPCPDGWRLPIGKLSGEWNQVRNNNDKTTTWTGTGTTSNDNYTSGVSIGKYLFLPAAGYRNGSGGLLIARGSEAIYWSSSASSNTTMGSLIRFFFNASHPNDVSSSHMNAARSEGYPVRCVSE